MMKARRRTAKLDSVQLAFTRFTFIVALFAIWILAIGIRLVHLQINQHSWLLERALDQRRDELRKHTPRGSILDRSGRVLALSVTVDSLMADPGEIENVEEAAHAIANAIGLKSSSLIADLNEAKKEGKRFLWIARRLDEDRVRKINETLVDEKLKKFDLPKFVGLHWRQEQMRTYPQGSLAAHVIGFSNSDDIGQAGIEQSQEAILRGTVEKTWRDRDRLGRVYDEAVSDHVSPKDVVLTISQTIQYKVEQALARGVSAAQAKAGSAIVLDPKTGEILAMASYPSYDPNNLNSSLPSTLVNTSVQSQFTPGSVFKLVTYSAALEKSLITPTQEIDCGSGEIKIAKHLFRDSHKVGLVSYTDALAQSSNVAAIKTGMRVGRESFYSYARKFGFGEPTGIELPAEARGIVRSPETWASDSLPSMAIGYEVSVTALQTASAFATIANDGIRVKPHLIKGIKQANGEIESPRSLSAQRVLSAETAGELRAMLRRVVEAGTGKRARLNGYSAAGKTGTAWKYDHQKKIINREKIVASFVGFAPLENPGAVIAVVIDEPQAKLRDGGHAAAPVFQEIAQEILPELAINPDPSLLRETEIREGDIEASIPSETIDDQGSGEQKISDRRTRAEQRDAISATVAESKFPPTERNETAQTKSIVEIPVREAKRERIVVKSAAKRTETKTAPDPESKPKSKTGEAKPARAAEANLRSRRERLNRKI